ncbi:glycosyltransferase [Pedobacter sp.]|nr:glycosyltransferase [Candidatus Saccharibacteria bacterium]
MPSTWYTKKKFMRIGLFTDTYRPAINGIVFVVESLKEHLEEQGHVVYIFCPARSIRRSKHADLLEEDEHVIRFPSVKGAFYDDYDTSIFFPHRALSQIKELDLDVIHYFTPGGVGMLGAFAAHKSNVPLVAQHCTDLYQYVEHYPTVLPGLLALVSLLPFTVKVDGKDMREIMKLYRPRRGPTAWNRDIVEKAVTLVYNKCDAVIALSRKSQHQLQSWQRDENFRYDVTLLPNGVDALPTPTPKKLAIFRKQWGIRESDEVFGFVGRLGAEKNLAMLIPTFEKVIQSRPHARLLFVGDFEYKETLEELAANSSHPERITFTGALPREELGVVYGVMDVFVFPSLTDTQGWVIHEAAMAGLPIVLIDRGVSDVVSNGENGIYAENSANSMAKAIVSLLKDPEKRQAFGEQSKKIARKFTEKKQVGKLAKLYEQAIIDHFSEENGR